MVGRVRRAARPDPIRYGERRMPLQVELELILILKLELGLGLGLGAAHPVLCVGSHTTVLPAAYVISTEP